MNKILELFFSTTCDWNLIRLYPSLKENQFFKYPIKKTFLS